MKLSGATGFLLRVMVKLAEIDRKVTARELSELTDIPFDHLMKVLQRLRDAQLINTGRGKGGGVWLVRDPSEVSVEDVLRRTGGLVPLRDCLFDPNFCKFANDCKIKDFYDDVNEIILQMFRDKSIAELI